jgi:serine/threonine protein kinase
VIQSAHNPNIWMLIDFGISVQTSGNPMSTQKLNGTAGYVAPEILRRELYTESVDIFPIGLILFEICTGHRAFSVPGGVLQLSFSPHQIMGPSMMDVASFYATSVIARPFGPISGNVRGLLHIFWDAVRDMRLTDERLYGNVYWGRDSRVEEINRFVRVMSHDNPKCRPSIESVAHHFRANLIRSLLEYDTV